MTDQSDDIEVIDVLSRVLHENTSMLKNFPFEGVMKKACEDSALKLIRGLQKQGYKIERKNLN